MQEAHRVEQRRILLTGANGYVGSSLLPYLLEAGYAVRCLVRHTDGSSSGANPEYVSGDVLNAETLSPIFAGIDTVVYLIHSLKAGEQFAELDRQAARNVARAALEGGVRRIIYLGGLGNSSETLSRHLASRQEVGEILRASGVQVIEFRASVIIGAGSLSFEMVRALTERLPVMTTPRWVDIPAQPIYIGDVLHYLLQAITLELGETVIYEIGGADRVSYGNLMREYARQRRLQRLFIPLPWLTPGLSSRWLGLVTPMYARVGRQLIDGIRSATVVRDPRALRDFTVSPLGMPEAVARALHDDDELWLARLRGGSITLPHSGYWKRMALGSRYLIAHATVIPAATAAVFHCIEQIGGKHGYFAANWLWRVRGLLDRLFGGSGLRRGRRDPLELRLGDTVDWWRVVDYTPERQLTLEADAKIPGRVWLSFHLEPAGEAAQLRQIFLFDAHGLTGMLYWYLLLPLHRWLYRRMLAGIAQACSPTER